jgi:hypothetical protein
MVVRGAVEMKGRPRGRAENSSGRRWVVRKGSKWEERSISDGSEGLVNALEGV